MKFHLQVLSVAMILATATIMTGCGKQNQANSPAGAKAGQQQQMPPMGVEVEKVVLSAIPVVKTFSGRVSAVETSEVRPQVSGIIESVSFREGTYVKAGQELYRLNRDNYVSAANSSIAAIETAESGLVSAKATLSAQEAVLAQARADLARVQGLVEIDAVSRQLYDQYRTAVRTAEANVAAARAGVNQAHASINNAKASHDASRLDMSRTIVRAPISGKIGISSVTAGALVSANQTTPLATITRTDHVYVDISQSSSELLRLRQQLASGKSSEGTAEAQIVLEDGEIYPLIGRLILSDARVDETTGSVTIRAVFPNPDGVLIPGMYVNANLAQTVAHNAVLLPQTAIMRTPKGDINVYVVDKTNKIQVRPVKTAGTFQGKWVVTEGLENGDNVVVNGASKVKPEQEVQILPKSGQAPQGQAQPSQAQNAPQGQAPKMVGPVALKPAKNADEQDVPAPEVTEAEEMADVADDTDKSGE